MTGYIYALFCPIKKEIRYIGQTTLPIKQRFNHHFRDRQQEKNKNNHKASWMCFLWDNYKLKPELELIETVENCTDEILNHKEKFWIKHYLNLGNDLTNTSGKDFFRVYKRHSKKNNKTIYCYDKNFDERIFESAREAGRVLGLSYKIISRVARLKTIFSEYCFSFVPLDLKFLSEYFSKLIRKNVSIVGKNILTGKIIEFRNLTEAAKVLKCNFRNIHLVLKKERHSAGGYYWKYKNNDTFYVETKRIYKSKRIISLDDGKEYNSPRECANQYGISINVIYYEVKKNKNQKFKYI